VQNPLAWVLALMALALAAFKREQQHGWMLDRIENDAGETARKDKQLRSAFREHVQASNEEYIGQMDEVNDQQAQYWRDSFDVLGAPTRRTRKARATQHPDDAATDGGETAPAIAAIDADEIRDSWLAKAWSTNRLADPQEALTCIRAACVGWKRSTASDTSTTRRVTPLSRCSKTCANRRRPTDDRQA